MKNLIQALLKQPYEAMHSKSNNGKMRRVLSTIKKKFKWAFALKKNFKANIAASPNSTFLRILEHCSIGCLHCVAGSNLLLKMGVFFRAVDLSTKARIRQTILNNK